MRIAWVNLRYTPEQRVKVFAEGCAALGFSPRIGCPQRFDPSDIFVTWNRIGHGDHCARECESAGVPVIVTENASWGNEFAGQRWYTLSRSYHNVATGFPQGGSERWDGLGVCLDPWRCESEYPETFILPSRGIGPTVHRMPADWPSRARSQARDSRVRSHPGRNSGGPTLSDSLSRCSRAITWGSGAAIKALMWGIRVESHMPHWIGEQDNTDAGRLAMFRRLAWAQWTLEEIETGEPMRRLIDTR